MPRAPGRPITEVEYLAARAKEHAKCLRSLKRLERLTPFAFVEGEGTQAAEANLALSNFRRALESVKP